MPFVRDIETGRTERVTHRIGNQVDRFFGIGGADIRITDGPRPTGVYEEVKRVTRSNHHAIWACWKELPKPLNGEY